MFYRLLTVSVLCAALLIHPVFAAEKKKPTPEELLNPTPTSAPIRDCKGYDAILKADATNLAALNGRGLCLNVINAGEGDADLNKAAELASALIAADPKNADAYYSRATTYRVMQDYKKAKDDYARAVELNPDNAFWKTDLETLTREVELRAQLDEQAAKKIDSPEGLEGRAEAALKP
ncbi:MAG: tetratricopeptide repeat protein [Alphaproteobacteria bacterium]